MTQSRVGQPVIAHVLAPRPNAGDVADMILIVGSTGQLGTTLVRRLAAKGERVRALVRPASRSAHLAIANVELAVGDLRDAASLDAACVGVDVIIATANTVAPN